MRLLPLLLAACSAQPSATDAESVSRDTWWVCEDTCDDRDALRCEEGAIERCERIGPCLVWSLEQDCAAIGATCVASEVGAACATPQLSTCWDGLLGPDEADVDCGGVCPPCGDGADCDLPEDCASGICTDGTCVPEPRCDDGLHNGDESDLDCGGSCDGCGLGQTCGDRDDCRSSNCDVGLTDTCVLFGVDTCGDGRLGLLEADVDCGGPCAPCPDGASCLASADCASTTCDVAGTWSCLPAGTPSCGDGQLGGTETDADCGGDCLGCGVGAACAVATDCLGGSCDTLTGTCAPPSALTCTDGRQSPDEPDLDCGGPCAPCPAGGACFEAGDCATGWCEPALGRCEVAPETCDDGVVDQDETGVDCGGSCPDCADGEACLVDGDCRSNRCQGQVCVHDPALTCFDGLKNQGETDADCGGGVCAPCAVGRACATADDCGSGHCDTVQGTCLPASAASCSNGRLDPGEAGPDCGGPCDACRVGDPCLLDEDCASLTCDPIVGTCLPLGAPDCADGLRDGLETDTDCGGPTCAPCALDQACATAADCAAGTCDPRDGRCHDDPPSWQSDEGFEQGWSLAWHRTSPLWTLRFDGDCAEGAGCVRAPDLTAGQSSAISLDLSVRQDAPLSFAARVLTAGTTLTLTVDGVPLWSSTGTDGWAWASVPVTATPLGGADRHIAWTASRTAGAGPVDVRLDAIDLPPWNSPPEAPTLVAPAHGERVPDQGGTLRWITWDPDHDPVDHEVQLDRDPSFPAPMSHFSDNTELIVGPLSIGIWYWRVRPRDDVDQRWGPWSAVRGVVFEPREPTAGWSLDPALLALAPSQGLAATADGLASYGISWTAYSGHHDVVPLREPTQATYGDALPVPVGTPATLAIDVEADLDSPQEWAAVLVDGLEVGTLDPGTCGPAHFDFVLPDAAPATADGTLEVAFDPTDWVTGCNVRDTVRMQVTADFLTEGSVRLGPWTRPSMGWGTLRLDRTGDVRARIEDADGPLSDALLPGNGLGFPADVDLGAVAAETIWIAITVREGGVLGGVTLE